MDGEDVDLLRSIVAGNKSCPSGKRCDVNKDGVITTADVTSLIIYIGRDFNNDGIVSEKDYDILNDVIAGKASCPSSKDCDINGDGIISTADATAFVLYYNSL